MARVVWCLWIGFLFVVIGMSGCPAPSPCQGETPCACPQGGVGSLRCDSSGLAYCACPTPDGSSIAEGEPTPSPDEVAVEPGLEQALEGLQEPQQKPEERLQEQPPKPEEQSKESSNEKGQPETPKEGPSPEVTKEVVKESTIEEPKEVVKESTIEKPKEVAQETHQERFQEKPFEVPPESSSEGTREQQPEPRPESAPEPGGCNPAIATPATNPACPTGKYCDADGSCKPFPVPVSGPRSPGQSCSSNPFEACDASLQTACLAGRCVFACDPRQGTASNLRCSAAEVCAESVLLSPLGGTCVAPATRLSGQDCNGYDQRCVAGLSCVEGRCGVACDPSKPASVSCLTGQVCYSLGLEAVCRSTCDPAQGLVIHPVCGAGLYCKPHTISYQPGVCVPLPLAPKGMQLLNQTCKTGSSTDDCDGNTGITCYAGLCKKVCDPRLGTTTNAACQTGQVCSEQVLSHLGGICIESATQNEGDACNALDKRCKSGLSCVRNRCHKICAISKGRTQNPDCTNPTKQWCFDDPFEPVAVCVASCNPSQGVAANADCPVGTYCKQDQGLYSPGYCYSLSPQLFGSQGFGNSCSNSTPSLYCNGNQRLFCKYPLCAAGCDPRLGTASNPHCLAGEECREEIQYSFLGGECRKAATQQEGQACDQRTLLCLQGFVCYEGFCTKTCNPAQGQTSNPACGAAKECVGTSQGYCVDSPSRQVNQTCNLVTQRCLTGFACVLFDASSALAFCKKECDPTVATTACPAGTQCVPTNVLKAKEGACIETRQQTRLSGETCRGSDPSKPDYNDCVSTLGCDFATKKCGTGLDRLALCGSGSAQSTCKSSLICVGGYTSAWYCQTPCNPTSPVACSGQERCVSLVGFGGACLKSCTADSDCTTYQSKCTSVGSSGSVCL